MQDITFIPTQIGQPDGLVEYQNYMRINGYVWSVTPVEGEVCLIITIIVVVLFLVLSSLSYDDFVQDLDLPRLDRLPRLGRRTRQLRLGHRSAQLQHDEL